MADKDAALVYESVANRSTTAIFVYEVNGEEYAVEYTLSFVYDIEAVKDAEISDAAKALNDEAADFGFAEIKYTAETKTGTFIFSETEKNRDLASYRDSEIVKFFMEIVNGATSVTYKVRNEEGAIVDKTVSLETLTDKKVISMAKEVLEAMADEDVLLTYGSVAGEKSTATFVYEVNGEKISVDYTLEFLMA